AAGGPGGNRAPQEEAGFAIERELLRGVRRRSAGEDDDLLAVNRLVGRLDGEVLVAVLHVERQREVREAEALLHLEAGEVAGVDAAARAAAADLPRGRAVRRADRRVGLRRELDARLARVLLGDGDVRG